MKTIAVCVFTLLALAVSAHARQTAAGAAPGAKAAGPSYKTHKLTRAEFDKLLAEPARLVVIDVRRPDEVASVGGFPVYLSIPADEIEQRLSWIPKDRTVVTVSNHANRSGRVADVLAGKGFSVAGTIGATDYQAAGGTLFKVAAPTAERTR